MSEGTTHEERLIAEGRCPSCGERDGHRFSCQRHRRDSLATGEKPTEQPRCGGGGYVAGDIEPDGLPTPCPGCEDCKPASEDREGDRWPVVGVGRRPWDGTLALFDPREAEINDPDGSWVRYHPESAPNVLSAEDARRLVHLAKVHGISFSGPELRALIDRLQDYASKEKSA